MPRKVLVCIMFAVVLLLIYIVFTFIFNIRPWEVPGKIFIRYDGSVVPSTTPIKREGGVYIFTEDIINKSIVVERSNIEIDGAEHRLQGFGILNGSGFDLNKVEGVTVKRVKISKFYWGVHMFLCSCCALQDNEMSNNAYGIHPNWSNSSIIAGNKVMDNEGGGIYLANSFNFSVEGNIVTSNSWYGIRLTSSDNCSIVENIVGNNSGIGIHIVLSSNNVVYHNIFVNNTKQAYIEGNVYNVWDDGYPSGGNYWSDYAGEDANDDGIGDTPYIIDENNVDRYPFMEA